MMKRCGIGLILVLLAAASASAQAVSPLNDYPSLDTKQLGVARPPASQPKVTEVTSIRRNPK
jgi:hypothetical protein